MNAGKLVALQLQQAGYNYHEQGMVRCRFTAHIDQRHIWPRIGISEARADL